MEKQTMGETICRLRKEKDMTQKDLAARMNVTDKAVSKWERDLSCPDVGSLPQLAEVLGVSVDVLLSAPVRESSRAAKGQDLPGLILRAIPLAMGAAVTVTALLREIDLYSGLSMVGIGLFCLSLSAFRGK